MYVEERAPFQAWLNHYINKHGGADAAALRLKMSQGEVVEQMRTTADGITVGTLDRYFTAAGEPHMLAVLYPLNDALTERWCATCRETVTVGRDGACPWCPPRTELTARQHEVLALAAEGLSSAQIAARLSLSVRTVAMHLKCAFRTLGVHNRKQAVEVARERGWL